jgi:hypothetical protein
MSMSVCPLVGMESEALWHTRLMLHTLMFVDAYDWIPFDLEGQEHHVQIGGDH